MSPCVDHPISRVVTAIRNKEVVTLTGGHLELRGGAWPGATSGQLFVRSFYAPLYDHVLKQCRAGGTLYHELRAARLLITGQPGTGKSVFLWYIANRLLSEQPGRSVVFIDGPQKSAVIIQPGGGVFAFPFDKIHELPFVDGLIDPAVLCDSHLPVLLPFPTIVASSPGSLARGDQAIRKEFMPPIHLPVPSRSEVLELRGLAFNGMPVEVVNRRMDLWGPIPRFVLVRTTPVDQRAQWERVQQVPLSDISRVMRGAAACSSAGVGDDGDATHRVVLEHAACEGAVPGSPAADPSRWEYYRRGPVVVTSNAIHRWLLDRMIAEQNWNAALLVDASARIAQLGALRGLMFEPLALSVLRRGGIFRIKRLRAAEDISSEEVDLSVTFPAAGCAIATADSAEDDSAAAGGAGKKRARVPEAATELATAASVGSSCPAVIADVTTGESLLRVPPQTARAWRRCGDLVGCSATPEMLVPENSNEAGLDALLWLGVGHHAPVDCTVSESHGLHQRGAADAVESLGWTIGSGWPRNPGPADPAVGEAGSSVTVPAPVRRAMQVQYFWVLPEDVWPLWCRPQSAKQGTGHAGLAKHLAQFALCIPQLMRFQAMRGILSELVHRPDELLDLLEASEVEASSAPATFSPHAGDGVASYPSVEV